MTLGRDPVIPGPGDPAQGRLRAGRRLRFEGHRLRIGRLDARIARIRTLGFGYSLDLLEVDYYSKEADFRLAEARAREAGK